MKKVVTKLLGLIFLVFPSVEALSSEHADPVFTELLRAKSLKCNFGPGNIGDWISSVVEVKKVDWGASALHFDSINPKSGEARLIGNAGSSTVNVFVTPAGITFIEQTGFGNLIFTTVFASYKKNTKEFHAVTSRHLNMSNGPLPSQYHGTCILW